MFCYRCEHRAQFLETGSAPRHECKQTDKSYGCYMYQPVRPVVIASNEGDDRPIAAGAMFSARCHGVRIAEGIYKSKEYEDGLVIYFIPEGVENEMS